MKTLFLINFIDDEIFEMLSLDRDEYQGLRVFDSLSNAKDAISKLSIQNKLFLIEDIDYEIIEVPLNYDFYANTYPLIIGGNIKSTEKVERNDMNNMKDPENKNFTLIMYKSSGEIHHTENYDDKSQAIKRLTEQQNWGLSGEIIDNKIQRK